MRSIERGALLYNELMRRALELTGSVERAEDLVHDTYVVLLLKPPKFRSDKALLHWLRKVMRNLHIDQARRRR